MTICAINYIRGTKAFGSKNSPESKNVDYSCEKKYDMKSDEFVKLDEKDSEAKSKNKTGFYNKISNIVKKVISSLKNIFEMSNSPKVTSKQKTKKELENITKNYIEQNGTEDLKVDEKGNYYNFEEIIGGKMCRGIQDRQTERIIGKVHIKPAPKKTEQIITKVTRTVDGVRCREVYVDGVLTKRIIGSYSPKTNTVVIKEYDCNKNERMVDLVYLKKPSKPGEVFVLVPPENEDFEENPEIHYIKFKNGKYDREGDFNSNYSFWADICKADDIALSQILSRIE